MNDAEIATRLFYLKNIEKLLNKKIFCHIFYARTVTFVYNYVV